MIGHEWKQWYWCFQGNIGLDYIGRVLVLEELDGLLIRANSDFHNMVERTPCYNLDEILLDF